MNNNINKADVLRKVFEDKTMVIDDNNNEYSKLVEMLGGEAITITPNSCTFKIVDDNDILNREEIIAKFKELYTLHLKFANEHNGQKINFNDIKEICEKNKFDITDDELLKLINDCEESLE